MHPVFLLQPDHGVEARSGRFAPHPPPQVRAQLLQGQGQGEHLGDALDGKGLRAVARANQLSVAGGRRYAETARIDSRQGGDIVGHPALAEMRLHVPVDDRDRFGKI